MYNNLVDFVVKLEKLNRNVMYKHPIEKPNCDMYFNHSIQALRGIVRRYMTKSDNFKKSRIPEE